MKSEIIKIICFVVTIISIYISLVILNEQIQDIKQDIVEIRKEFSYDPKDAK